MHLSSPCPPPPCPFSYWGMYFYLTDTVKILHPWCIFQSASKPPGSQCLNAMDYRPEHTASFHGMWSGHYFCPSSPFSAFVVGRKGAVIFHETIATRTITGSHKQNCPRELCSIFHLLGPLGSCLGFPWNVPVKPFETCTRIVSRRVENAHQK